MLMADHVKVSAAGVLENGTISKGVRLVNAQRDIFYDSSSGAFSPFSSHGVKSGNVMGHRVHNGNGAATGTLPFFGTTFMFWSEGHSSSLYNNHSATLGGSAANVTHVNNTGSLQTGHGDIGTSTTTVPLGMTSVGVTFPTAYNFYALGVATPIHTSSHYQPFETPYLKELVAGDRNMEQTNLVVTADGKSWDEVTRDTSYIGSLCVRASHNNHYTSESSVNIHDEWRGISDGPYALMNKDFAIAYNRVVCLVDGEYQIYSHNVANNSCLLYTSPSPRDGLLSRMPSSA